MRKFANEYQSSKKREKKSIDGTRGHTSKRTKKHNNEYAQTRISVYFVAV